MACAAWPASSAVPARAGTANAGLPSASARNPLAGITWGVYRGPIDRVYPAYRAARGRDRQLLAKIALRPLTVWTGAWYPVGYARTLARQIIADTTGGDPSRLTQIAVFRLDPWEAQACPGSWSAADQAAYRAWINEFATGIGESRVALILQPDLPFAVCARSPVPLRLVAYAAAKLSGLRHTTVYIDAGAAQWLSAPQAAAMLKRAGVRRVRGFALNVTQYGGTGMELRYGAGIARALRAAGVRGKHFVINTDENGVPFLAGQYPGDANQARVCGSPSDRLCVALGIPPTTDVGDRRWGLSPPERAIARREADAYLWAGRPWVDYTGAFAYPRALQLAASSPF